MTSDINNILLLILIILSIASSAYASTEDQKSLRRRVTKKKDKTKNKSQKSKKKDKKKKKQRKGEFDITLINVLPSSNENELLYDKAFGEAKERWEQIILNDVSDISADDFKGDIFGGSFADIGVGPISMDIDDVVIGYAITSIDGPGGVLGKAGPRFYRLSRQYDDYNNLRVKFSTISAVMIFDSDDFDRMIQVNGLESGYEMVKAIILHEMAHALGFGVMTELQCGSLCHLSVTSLYSCGGANTEYFKIYGTLTLRLSSATGTCDHWQEDSFQSKYQSELLTPFFDPDKRNPLTAVTIAAMEDLGYEVDMNAADPWYEDNFFEENGLAHHHRNVTEPMKNSKFVVELTPQNMLHLSPPQRLDLPLDSSEE